MEKTILAIILIIALALSLGIIRHALRADNFETDKKVIADINGEAITTEDLFDTITAIPPNELAKLSQQGDGSSGLLEQMIINTLLLQEAKRRGLDESPDIQRKLENYNKELLINAVIKEELEKIQSHEESTPTADEAKKRPAVWARHIALKDMSTAQKALSRLQSGESFSAVAQELSIGTDRTKGGEIGWVIEGEPLPKIGYEPKIEAALFSLEEEEISDLVKTRTRIHIVKVEKKGVEGDEFKGQIAIKQEKVDTDGLHTDEKSINRHIEQYITKLKRNAKITIYSENMPKIIFGPPSHETKSSVNEMNAPSTDELLESEIE